MKTSQKTRLLSLRVSKHTVSAVGLTSLVLALSACQTQIDPLGTLQPRFEKSADALVTNCQAQLPKSKTPQTVVGKIIQTPQYALVTFEAKPFSLDSGHLCILDKATGHTEVSAINQISYIAP